jgi:hypothetical protein
MKTFKKNGYSRHDIKQILCTRKKWPQNEKVTGVAMSPYKHSASKSIPIIKSVHTPSKKNIHTLRPAKENLVLKTPCIYYIPSKCCKIYVGQTCKTIEARSEEHLRYLCLGQVEKSAMAEHIMDVEQYMNLTISHRLNEAMRPRYTHNFEPV